MIYNMAMEKILLSTLYNDASPSINLPIWEKKNCIGQSYWGVGNFCGLDKGIINVDCNLTDLEWDGNEIRLTNSTNIPELVEQGLEIIITWKKQMEHEYPKISFDIFLSVDKGDEDISPSVTLRFWAVRNGYHYIIPDCMELEKYKINPILMEQVNYGL